MPELAKAEITLLVQGMNKVQSDLSAVKGGLFALQSASKKVSDNTKDLGKQGQDAAKKIGLIKGAWNEISKTAAIAFATMTGGIAGLLKLAAPRDFDNFSAAVAVAGVHLGTIFLPLLRQATDLFTRLGDVINDLSPQQKDQILKWTEIGLAIAGGIVVVNKLSGAFGLLSVALKGVFAVIGLLLGSNPIGWIILAIGAVAALAVGFAVWQDKMAEGGSILDALKDVWNGFLEIVNQVWDAVKPFVDDFLDMMSGVVDNLLGYFDYLKEHISVNMDSIKEAIASLRPIFQTILSFVRLAIDNLIRSFITLGIVIREVLHGNFDFGDIRNKVEQELANLDAHIGERIDQRKENRAKKAEQKAGLPPGAAAKDPERFTPLAPRQAPALIGITEAWRKAQQTLTDDPKAKIAQAQLEEAMKNNQKLDQLIDLQKDANRVPVGARQ